MSLVDTLTWKGSRCGGEEKGGVLDGGSRACLVMEGDPGTGQAVVEGDELDTDWLESEVSVGLREQVQKAAGIAGFAEKEPEGQRGCFCQLSQVWEGATSRSEPGSIALRSPFLHREGPAKMQPLSLSLGVLDSGLGRVISCLYSGGSWCSSAAFTQEDPSAAEPGSLRGSCGGIFKP